MDGIGGIIRLRELPLTELSVELVGPLTTGNRDMRFLAFRVADKVGAPWLEAGTGNGQSFHPSISSPRWYFVIGGYEAEAEGECIEY